MFTSVLLSLNVSNLPPLDQLNFFFSLTYNLHFCKKCSAYTKSNQRKTELFQLVQRGVHTWTYNFQEISGKKVKKYLDIHFQRNFLKFPKVSKSPISGHTIKNRKLFQILGKFQSPITGHTIKNRKLFLDSSLLYSVYSV